MAYILGYIFADGSLEYAPKIRGKYFRITSTDEEILPKIKRCLDSEHTISKILLPEPNRKPRYFFRVGNAHIYDTLLRYGLHPHKSLTIQMPAVPKKFLGDFARGYFDGDGCVYIEHKNGAFRRLRVIFTSGSKIFLDELEKKLRSTLGLKQKDIYKNKNGNIYQLSYSTADSMALFDLMYEKSYDGLYLKRKYEKFVSILTR